ncbi:MAG: YdcF family protein [Flavobacteriales bacterium]|nr:YdcF family protein [Flavobacteriales bacterium]
MGLAPLARLLLNGIPHMAGDPPSPKARRRWWCHPLVWCALILIGLLLLRIPLLSAMGAFLVAEDALHHADAIHVLGGASWERPLEGARLFKEGYADRVVCTSENVPQDLQALGLDLSEAELARMVLVQHGVPESAAIALRKATSTKEEADAILEYALSLGQDTLILVSTPFHLRRMAYVFRSKFKKAGVTVILHGAPTARYDMARWWRYEEGLLMVNNEYVKLGYYLLKY